MTTDSWTTDEDLHRAFARLSDLIPGFKLPVAYSIALEDRTGLTFGHVNCVGAVRPLPAIILAHVCGYRDQTAVFRLDTRRVRTAVDLLAPAEGATHMSHPNLWSWRRLLRDAKLDSKFIAFFLADATDAVVDDKDQQFRTLIAP